MGINSFLNNLGNLPLFPKRNTERVSLLKQIEGPARRIMNVANTLTHSENADIAAYSKMISASLQKIIATGDLHMKDFKDLLWAEVRKMTQEFPRLKKTAALSLAITLLTACQANQPNLTAPAQGSDITQSFVAQSKKNPELDAALAQLSKEREARLKAEGALEATEKHLAAMMASMQKPEGSLGAEIDKETTPIPEGMAPVDIVPQEPIYMPTEMPPLVEPSPEQIPYKSTDFEAYQPSAEPTVTPTPRPTATPTASATPSPEPTASANDKVIPEEEESVTPKTSPSPEESVQPSPSPEESQSPERHQDHGNHGGHGGHGRNEGK